MWRLLLLTSLLAGCQTPGSRDPKPRQVEAVDIVWRQFYGQHGGPPEVEWHRGYHLYGSTDGFTWAGWKVDLADYEQDPPRFFFSLTALAHELMHERTFERTGDVDVGHFRGDWQLVDDANWYLSQRGM